MLVGFLTTYVGFINLNLVAEHFRFIRYECFANPMKDELSGFLSDFKVTGKLM